MASKCLRAGTAKSIFSFFFFFSQLKEVQRDWIQSARIFLQHKKALSTLLSQPSIHHTPSKGFLLPNMPLVDTPCPRCASNIQQYNINLNCDFYMCVNTMVSWQSCTGDLSCACYWLIFCLNEIIFKSLTNLSLILSPSAHIPSIPNTCQLLSLINLQERVEG